MTPEILAEPNKLWWFVPAAAFIALLYFLSPILAPFLFAAIIACISNPLVSWLAVPGYVLGMLLVPVVLFYLLRDWNGLLALPASAALLLGLRHLGGQHLSSSLYQT